MSIKIESLNKSYNNNLILDDLDLTIKTGSIFGLLGPNGAGKTTLISILNYLTNKDSGNIKIFDYSFEKQQEQIKSISSFIPQSYAFYPNLTTYENLEFFGALYGLKNKELKDKIDYCINSTSLEKYINKKASTYSGGVKRRLNIAIGLLNSPQIIYLDEPTVGIDPQSRKYILNVIKNINEQSNTTIVYTSHYMEEVEFLCDDIAILDNKKIILHEKKDILIKENSKVSIELKDETIFIDVSESYENFIKILKNINPKDIIKINGENKNLEEMFLTMTKGKLRD